MIGDEEKTQMHRKLKRIQNGLNEKNISDYIINLDLLIEDLQLDMSEGLKKWRGFIVTAFNLYIDQLRIKN